MRPGDRVVVTARDNRKELRGRIGTVTQVMERQSDAWSPLVPMATVQIDDYAFPTEHSYCYCHREIVRVADVRSESEKRDD